MLIDDYVRDMTNFNLKQKIIEICQEVEKKDDSMVLIGQTIIEKLWRCVWKLKIEESEVYPTDSLHNVMKNLEILTLDIEDKIDQATLPDKHDLLNLVQ